MYCPHRRKFEILLLRLNACMCIYFEVYRTAAGVNAKDVRERLSYFVLTGGPEGAARKRWRVGKLDHHVR